MEEYLPIIIQLISGAVAGKLLPKQDLGTLVNSVLGILGRCSWGQCHYGRNWSH